jgi:hydrogenase nickel incorporation protein HypA/HybF
MHEWALAEAVIAAASEIAEKEDLKKIIEINVRVGELQGIELDILEFAFSQLRTNKFKDARFNIETAEAKLKCRVCNHQWVFEKDKLDERIVEAIHFLPEVAHTYVKCPNCGSPDFKIVEGRGIWLENVKGEK